MRDIQTFQRMEMPSLRQGDVPFTDGNAAFAAGRRALCGWKRRFCGWGHALYAWKRRCADVRAGTQAPPLRFRLSRLRMKQLMLFEQITHETVDVVWADCVRTVGFVWADYA